MTNTNKKLIEKIKEGNADIHINFGLDIATLKDLLRLLYDNDYNFVGLKKRYDIEQPINDLRNEIWKDWLCYFHGNSRPLLHAFYNNITHKKELQWTTKSIMKTYPQYKNAKVIHFYGIV